MVLNYLWVGELGNITNYGIAEVGSRFAFVWTNGTLPRNRKQLDEMGWDSESGSEYHRTLSDAIQAAEECFEFEARNSRELLEGIKRFKEEVK